MRRGLESPAAEQVPVPRRHLLAQRHLLIEDRQLRQQDGRLQRIQPAVHANADMVVAPLLTVMGDLAHHRGQFVVVGEDRPAVAVAAQRLAGKEAGTGDG
ncbi:hypothetical protein D3C72_2036180 [compost metagenome]